MVARARAFASRPRRWAVFLDRDGTLVRDAHHAVRPEQLELFPGAGDALRLLAGAGARLVLVSNQSAMARGLLTVGGLRAMDRRIRGLVAAERVRLSRTYYCPHHPDFSGPCRCRKPEPGMLEEGLRDLGLEAGNCYVIGDTAADLAAGDRLGIPGVLVLTGHGRRDRADALDRGLARHVARDLLGAARWVVGDRSRIG